MMPGEVLLAQAAGVGTDQRSRLASEWEKIWEAIAVPLLEHRWSVPRWMKIADHVPGNWDR
jgi:hypothetical protein